MGVTTVAGAPEQAPPDAPPEAQPDERPTRGRLRLPRSAVLPERVRRVLGAGGPEPGVSPPPLAALHDVRGPRARRGVLWFVATTVTAVASPLALAVLLALAAGFAADQVVRLRAIPFDPGAPRRAEPRAPIVERVRALVSDPRRLPVALAAAALPLAAAAGVDTLAAALAGAVLVVLGARVLLPGDGPDGALGDMAVGCTAAIALGLAAAGPVLLDQVGRPAGVVFVLLVAAYDLGDFIVGTGAATAWEGPVAGVVTVLVVAFAASVIALPPLSTATTLGAGALAAVLAPLGPPAASLLVGDGRRSAVFVRRIDSLLVLGPVAAWVGLVLWG